MELDKMWLDERSSTNPLRIPHPKIDKLACQAQGVGIFAIGEILSVSEFSGKALQIFIATPYIIP